MKKKKLELPLSEESIKNLNAGDYVLLNGDIYVARDAAHKRLSESLKNNEELPFNLQNNTIYYMGPTPTPEGEVIGSAGPTTSHRMDKYTPELLDLGLKGMIGKGNRTKLVIDSIKKNKAIYFTVIGGAGALLQNHIKKNELIAYEDLGPEAIRKLKVEDFPAIVTIDSNGINLFDSEYKKYNTQNGGEQNENGN